MTPANLNTALRQNFPTAHRWMRRTARFLFIDHPLPCPALPRRLDGRRVWVHPRFVATPLDVEPHVRHWLDTYLKPGDTFFDVGAYVGWHTIYAARRVGPLGKIVAFEASPANAAYLQFHRRKNRLSQLEVVAAAVADRPSGELTLHLLNGGDSTSNSLQCSEAYTISQANQNLTRVTVPMTNLDTHALRHVPDLIKIDVEGAEMLALAGARKILTERRPPIILAAHPAWLPAGETPEALLAAIRQHDYVILDTDGNPATTLDFADYLCLPGEQLRTRN